MGHKQAGIVSLLLLFIAAISAGVLFSNRLKPTNQSSTTPIANQSGNVEGVQTNALVYGFNIPDYAGPYGINPTPVPGFDVNNNRIPAAIVTGLKPMAVTNSYYDPPGRQTYINNRWELQSQNIAYWPKVISSGPWMVLSGGSGIDINTGDIPFDLTQGCSDPRVLNWLNYIMGGVNDWGLIDMAQTAKDHPGANWFVPPHEPQNPDQISYSASVGQNVSEWMTSPRTAVCLVRKFVKVVRTADPTAKLWFPTLSTGSNSRLTVDQWLTQFSAAEDAIPHIGDFDVQLKSIKWEGLALTWYPSPAGCRGVDKYNPNCFLQSVSSYKALLSNPNSTYSWIPSSIAFAEVGITSGSSSDTLPAGCTSTDACIASWFTTAWPQLASRGVKAAFFYALDLTWWTGMNSNHGLCVYDKNTKTCPWTPVGNAFYTLSSQSSPVPSSTSIPPLPSAVPTVCTQGATTCQCPPDLSGAQLLCSYPSMWDSYRTMYKQYYGATSPFERCFQTQITCTQPVIPTVTGVPTSIPTVAVPTLPASLCQQYPTLSGCTTTKPAYCAIYPFSTYAVCQ